MNKGVAESEMFRPLQDRYQVCDLCWILVKKARPGVEVRLVIARERKTHSLSEVNDRALSVFFEA